MRTCISPDGVFFYGIHKPSFRVDNLRYRTKLEVLGCDQYRNTIDNHINYPENDVDVPEADWIYEIANTFPFRGATFIGKTWADRSAEDYEGIKLPPSPHVSFSQFCVNQRIDESVITRLPRPLRLSLATCSTDPEDLVELAHSCCRFTTDDSGNVTGLQYQSKNPSVYKPDISDYSLFEAVANNPALPDNYKIAMVIRPGAQGGSEIVGDFHKNTSHVYEYMRRNSYIGGGHYAANMADDAIRYDIASLNHQDMSGLRFLYYQRSYVRLAKALDIEFDAAEPLTTETLETLRLKIRAELKNKSSELAASLWGWNFGFDFAPTGYRLHASHQQIHQQYALLPQSVDRFIDGSSPPQGYCAPFSCGDMIAEAIAHYHQDHGKNLFDNYLHAINTNKRMDGRTDRDNSLIVWQDEDVMLFVPKAQTSQWELQIMTKPDSHGIWPGNILETDLNSRQSLDIAILKAQQALAGRGARMVTSIEYSKRFNSPERKQPILYCLLPKLPESPGAFSENQHRFINGHYPEDFAAVCRQELS